MSDLDNGGRLVVRLPVDHWARIDRRILDDSRLSIQARGVLAWAGSRPEGHMLWITNLMKRCGVGKNKWQRIRLELQLYGYLTSAKVRDIHGRFGWIFEINLCFIEESTIAPKTGDGSAGDGKQGYIERQNCRETESRDINLNHHTPQPAACAAGFKAKPAAITSKTSTKSISSSDKTEISSKKIIEKESDSSFKNISSEIKKKRGRPSKNLIENNSVSLKTKKQRGRPSKNPVGSDSSRSLCSARGLV